MKLEHHNGVTTAVDDVVAGSYASGRQSSDAVKGYKSVTFRPTSSPSSLPSTHNVKYSTNQQTDSSSASEQTANGTKYRLLSVSHIAVDC